MIRSAIRRLRLAWFALVADEPLEGVAVIQIDDRSVVVLEAEKHLTLARVNELQERWKEGLGCRAVVLDGFRFRCVLRKPELALDEPNESQ